MEKKASFDSIAREVINETMDVDKDEYVDEKNGKPPIQIESAVKKLRRKFEKLVKCFKGDISMLGDNGRTSQFGELEQVFLHTVLTHLATNTGISTELLKMEKEEGLDLSDIHEYIQGMIDIMVKKGYADNDILENIPQLDAIFHFTILQIAEECHSYVDTTMFNIRDLPYLKQVGVMKKLAADMKDSWLSGTAITIRGMIFDPLENMIKANEANVDIADIRRKVNGSEYKEE